MLLRYLIRTISIEIGQPKLRNIRLTAVIPAVLAPLRSMTILRGRPFTSRARAKNLVAAVLLRRFDSMKSRVLAARYVERPGRTSPPFPGHDMVAGQRLREDWYPRLFDRAFA